MLSSLEALRRRANSAARTLAGDEAIEASELDASLAPSADAFGLLHHAVRERAVDRRVALPGSYLAVEDDSGEEQLIPLEGDLLHLGRSSSAEIQLEDIRVSRKHAIISRYAGQVRVLDDASSTGTFVNGVSIVATTLADGDVIRIGPIVFTYVVVR